MALLYQIILHSIFEHIYNKQLIELCIIMSLCVDV